MPPATDASTPAAPKRGRGAQRGGRRRSGGGGTGSSNTNMATARTAIAHDCIDLAAKHGLTPQAFARLVRENWPS